ncbi:FixH family protein [Sediminicola luteus]|uniref:Cytochrome C oxidase Cbb3 n=1 Tax=Sediminicola luteus TaxID=319238 RepID=A0A2A4GDX1_9FLAO|nr:FixH family protein [Sediminicola luteus]PCE65985.1 cytochrome C oxidase Cbb3 [Sediminicola luteus]
MKKLNWGTGIVIAIVSFIGFIMYFVIYMSTNRRADHDLVTEDYYKQELEYQKEIDAEKKTGAAYKITIEKTKEGLVLSFPEHLDPAKIQGTVSLYRPSNKHLDFDLPLSLSDPHLLIPDTRLLDGRWDLKIDWKYQDDAYLQKESITWVPQ